MSNIRIKLHKNQLQLDCEMSILDIIREKFSVAHRSFGGNMRSKQFMPTRKYVITPQGKFDMGLLKLVAEQCHLTGYKVTIDPEVVALWNTSIPNPSIVSFPGKTYRDYQEETILAALKQGKGVSEIPTTGGKTLIMAGLYASIKQSMRLPNLRVLVIVPTLQLVTQTTADFKEYGLESVDFWCGGNVYNPKAQVIVALTNILLSDKTDLSVLGEFDVLFIDEVQGLKRGNRLNDVLKFITTPYKFGFTGTVPEDPIDAWNIIGKIGPVSYKQKTHTLRDQGYVSKFKIIMMEIIHKAPPKIAYDEENPSQAYREETDFLIKEPRRNEIICNLASKLTNNTLIVVDRIEHGTILVDMLSSLCPNKLVYFIQGETDIKEREHIRTLMDKSTDVVVVAISKIFSTGINIPNLHNLIFAYIGKSFTKVMQTIGRVIRLHASKECAIVFDLSDNTKYGRKHADTRRKIYLKEKYEYTEKTIS